jgi:hypothetical protein
MNRVIVWVWWVAMLLVVRVTMWPAESQRRVEPMWLGAGIDGRSKGHPLRLATTVEALEEGISMLRRGALVAIGGPQVKSIQRPRACTLRRSARGPPVKRRRRGA